MKLVTVPEWANQIPSFAPDYEYERIVPVEGIELRYISIRHHTDGGVPDYIEGVLADTDVFAPELPGWSTETAKLIAKMARGDYKARERITNNALWLKERDPGAYDYNTFIMKALYNTGVNVAFVDYKTGSEYQRMVRKMQELDVTEMYPIFQAREQFILEALCKSLKDFRQSPKAPDRPLRVAMTFGAMHMGMPIGLEEAGSQHGVSTAITQEFEDSMMDQGSAPDNDTFLGSVIDYQNWLRTGQSGPAASAELR